MQDSSVIAQQTQTTECPAIVNETVCVQAEVTITPELRTGKVKTICLGEPFFGACPGTPSPTGTCIINVSQRICVQVPLTFAATANAELKSIVCGKKISY